MTGIAGLRLRFSRSPTALSPSSPPTIAATVFRVSILRESRYAISVPCRSRVRTLRPPVSSSPPYTIWGIPSHVFAHFAWPRTTIRLTNHAHTTGCDYLRIFNSMKFVIDDSLSIYGRLLFDGSCGLPNRFMCILIKASFNT